MRKGHRRLSMLRVAAAMAAIAVSAISCISTTNAMRKWIGKPEAELISSWGPPTASQELDDGRVVHTWRTYWGGREKLRTCLQSFTIAKSGEIERTSYVGCARLQPAW